MKVLTESGSAHDISIGSDGLLAVSEGRAAQSEIVGCVLRTLLGEVQLNPSIGVDYIGTVFKSATRIGIWKHYAIEAVKRLPFVRSVASLDTSWNPSTRTMNFVMMIETDDGPVEVRS